MRAQIGPADDTSLGAHAQHTSNAHTARPMAVICEESESEEEDEAERHSEKAIEDARVVLALIELSIRNVPLTLEFLRRALPL